MSVGIGELHTAIHVEFEGRGEDRDSRLDFDTFVRLVRTPLGELAVAHNVHAHLVDVHFLYLRALRSDIHREASHHIFRRRGLVIEGHDRHQVLAFAQFHSVSLRETGFCHFQAGSGKK